MSDLRPGDVYLPSAADQPQARRERDRILSGDVDAHDDGALRVTETDDDLPAGRRVVTATAGGQVMAQFTVPVPGSGVAEGMDAVTIGEALQAAAETSAGDRPVDPADAAAVQAAEARATGLGGSATGGVAAAAQKAAQANMRGPAADADDDDDEKEVVRLKDVVGAAAASLPADKVATREDASKVAAAAGRNVDGATTRRGGGAGKGVSEAVAAAAERNEGRMLH